MKTVIITMTFEPGQPVEMDMKTNGVSKMDIIGGLQVFTKQLAIDIVESAKKIVGNDPAAIERYLDNKSPDPSAN